MRTALTIAKRSKDPNTKVGCVLVSPDGREVSTGWNGFPAGMKETAELWQRPHKYERVIHAELNAILNARRDLTGWTIYSTLLPCTQCCLAIIQSKIGRVVYCNAASESVDQDISISLLEDNGVSVDIMSMGD